MKSPHLSLAIFLLVALGSSGFAMAQENRFIEVGKDTHNREVFLDTQTISNTGFDLLTPLPSNRTQEMNLSMSCSEGTVQIMKVSILADGVKPFVVQKKPSDVIRYEPNSIAGKAMAITCRRLGVAGY
jgi:hypothetical protein